MRSFTISSRDFPEFSVVTDLKDKPFLLNDIKYSLSNDVIELHCQIFCNFMQQIGKRYNTKSIKSVIPEGHMLYFGDIKRKKAEVASKSFKNDRSKSEYENYSEARVYVQSLSNKRVLLDNTNLNLYEIILSDKVEFIDIPRFYHFYYRKTGLKNLKNMILTINHENDVDRLSMIFLLNPEKPARDEGDLPEWNKISLDIGGYIIPNLEKLQVTPRRGISGRWIAKHRVSQLVIFNKNLISKINSF